MSNEPTYRVPDLALPGHRPLWHVWQLAAEKAHLLWLAGLVTIYIGLSLYQINLPGLHYDEAFEAVPALQLARGQPVTTFRNNGLSMGDWLLPLMTQDYIGALNTYLALPFIHLLGATPAALRSMSILVGTVTLGLAYGLAGRLSGDRRVGLVAALLLAADPTFIFWNRQGVFVTAVTAAIGLAATLCWLRRFRGGSRGWSIAGAFLFGLGLYAKLLFLWLIVALIGAGVLLNLPHLIKQRTRLVHLWQTSRSEIAGAGLVFFLGCWPLIAYNIQTGGTLKSIAENRAVSYYGVNNLAFVSNLAERLSQFLILLGDGHLWYLGQIISTPLPSFAFGFTLILVVFVALLTTRNKIGGDDARPDGSDLRGSAKAALFPFLVIGLVILASIGTVSALWLTHFAVIMPWPALAIAVGGHYVLVHLSRRLPSRRSQLAAVIWVGVGLLALSNLWNTIRYHQALSESGGLSTHSDAVYDMSEWLAAEAEGPVVTMDWGLAAPITYLTGGQVEAIELFGYSWEPDAALINRLATFIRQPNTLYLWRAPDEIIFDRSGEFKALYRPLDLEEDIEAAFYERNGRPILGVTRLVEKGTAENPPK